MTWVLYLIGMLALIGIWDVDSKLKKLLRNQNAEEPGGESRGGGSFDLSSLKDKKVKIYLNDDSEVYDSLYLYGHDAVTGEITDFDDSWVEFTFTAPRYEKVPEAKEGTGEYKLVPIKNANVTLYIRISDIESIDEVTDEN
ncbi:MAG: hypothetical protein E7229_01355 [Clostridiales bacterium]|nr:hypothetical protein [Clostridiales bacterium]